MGNFKQNSVFQFLCFCEPKQYEVENPAKKLLKRSAIRLSIYGKS